MENIWNEFADNLLLSKTNTKGTHQCLNKMTWYQLDGPPVNFCEALSLMLLRTFDDVVSHSMELHSSFGFNWSKLPPFFLPSDWLCFSSKSTAEPLIFKASEVWHLIFRRALSVLYDLTYISFIYDRKMSWNLHDRDHKTIKMEGLHGNHFHSAWRHST